MQEDTLLINVESKELRCAHLRGGKLHNLAIERKKDRQITGNIYKGEVTNVLENIQSAFVKFRDNENGFVHISDVVENSRKLQERFDIDMEILSSEEEESAAIQDHLKEGQSIMVQVVKEAIGSKGARLTSNISMAGRYLVLLPNSPHRGVSKKIDDSRAREKLRRLIKGFDLPDNIGLICRTACKRATAEQIHEEAQALLDEWHAVTQKFNASKGPALLCEENDLLRRTCISAIDDQVGRILVDDNDTYQVVKQMLSKYSNEHSIKIEFYRDMIPMFHRFGVEKEIDRALRRKIWLNSGSYLYFDRTEAMCTIDVNSGRSSSNGKQESLEENILRINLEAAEEIARQLRIRNIGGLIICDFIDMRVKKNQKRLLDHLRSEMKSDFAKCSILGISEFGLIEMTRQRHRESLPQMLLTDCPYCDGCGSIRNLETTAIAIERDIKRLINCNQEYAIEIVTHPQLHNYIQETDKEFLMAFAESLNGRIRFSSDCELHLNDYYFINTLNGSKITMH